MKPSKKEEMFAAIEKAKTAEQDPRESQPVNMYLEDHFKEYVQEKYVLDDKSIVENAQIMQMIYALEWFDIPRTAYSDLIEFHPDLTAADHDRLFYVNTQHRIENFISMTLFSLLGNRYARQKGGALLQRRLIRFPLVLGLGGALSYALNVTLLKPILLHDLGEMGLVEKYFELDLNADMMREDLEKLGIHIDARHFDMEHAMARAEALEKAE